MQIKKIIYKDYIKLLTTHHTIQINNIRSEKYPIKIAVKYIKTEIFFNKTIFAFDRVHL